ncbi:MAG: DUF6788 family protein [Dehalococcoidia bacterium]
MDTSFSFEGRTYRPQLVRCGKAGCKTCARKGGHGPYWYAFWKVKARTVSRYIGKVLPPGITPPAGAVAAPPGWRAQRCTPAALRVINAAWQLADYGLLYPEHLMLALARSDEGLGPRVLRTLGVNEATLRPLMTTVTVASRQTSGRRLAGFAAGEARRWHDPSVGTEHLLLAVLRLPSIAMIESLIRQGVTADRATAAVATLRGIPGAGKRCAACRKPLRANWQFCPHCGIARAQPDGAFSTRPETQPI